MKNDELSIIVERVLKNKEKHFEELFSVTWDTVYYLSLTMMKSTHDAEDISQEVFIKIYDNIHTLQSSKAFNQWMNRIVMNACNRALANRSKKSRDYEIDRSQSYDMIGDFIAEDNMEFLPAELMDSKETRAIIAEMVEELPEKQKETVLLYYFQDNSIEDMCKILDSPQSVISSRLYYARETLRNKIEKMQKSQGFKLYGVGGVFFLGPILKAYAADVCTASVQDQVWTSVSGKITSTIASLTAGGAGTAASTSSSSSFVASLAGKITIAALSATIIGSVTLGVYMNNKPQEETPNSIELSTTQNSNEQEVQENMPSTDDGEIKVLEDMVGVEDASIIRSWWAISNRQERVLLSEIIERHGFTMSGAYVDVSAAQPPSYVLYTLEKKDKRLLVCEYYNTDNMAWSVVFGLEEVSNSIPQDSTIKIWFEQQTIS